MASREISAPERLPEIGSLDLLDQELEIFNAESERIDSSVLRRSLYWMLRLRRAFTLEKYLGRISGLRFPAFGFLDPETELDAFGVAIIATPALWSGPSRFELELVDKVEVDDHAFPVVVRRIRESYHSPFSDPPGAQAACLCQSKIQPSPSSGAILTAKHVLPSVPGRSPSIGDAVQLTCGCIGTISALAPDGIDAAIISSSCIPVGGQPIASLQTPIPWADVIFQAASGNTISTKITLVTDTRGIYNSPLLPIRIFFADYGQPGDSGALVRLHPNGEAVGIYIGSYTDPSGVSGGIAQHAFQAESLLKINLYQ